MKMLNKRDLAGINKDTEMLNVKYITFENKHSTSIWLKSRIQFNKNIFKLIKFDNSKKEQIEEPVEKKDIKTYMTDILAKIINNCLLFKNNVKYA